MKYHELSTKVSIVSVSRRAGLPQRGQATLRNSARLFSGLPLPSGMQSSGSTTGRSLSGTGTAPHPGVAPPGPSLPSQWMMGMGVPQ